MARNTSANGHECYHCGEWIPAGQAHDCWTTTESALTRELSEDLQDAYQRIREAAVEFGEQRIYASGTAIMFARKTCYFFVRPKRAYLETVIFLGRAVTSPLVKRVEDTSRVKRAHVLQIRHRDEVESPITDWLLEAYEFEPLAKAAAKSVTPSRTKKTAASKKATVKKPARKAAPRNTAARKK